MGSLLVSDAGHPLRVIVRYVAKESYPAKLYTLHFTLCTIHFTLYTLHYTLYTLYFTLNTLHFTLYALHSTLYVVYSVKVCTRMGWENCVTLLETSHVVIASSPTLTTMHGIACSTLDTWGVIFNLKITFFTFLN